MQRGGAAALRCVLGRAINMDHSLPRDTTLALLELGSPWPRWANDLLYNSSDSLILVQRQDETPDAFATRALRKLRENEALSCRLTAVILSSSEDASEEAVQARARVARTAVANLREGAPAHFGIGLNATAPAALQASLSALAASLAVEIRKEPLEVRLLLEPSAEPPGILLPVPRQPSATPQSPPEAGPPLAAAG